MNLVVVAGTYLNPKEAAVAVLPHIPRWQLFLISNKLLNPETLIKEIGDIPVFIVHGENDDYFPMWHAKALVALANGKEDKDKHLICVPGGGHLNLFNHIQREHYELLARYIG